MLGMAVVLVPLLPFRRPHPDAEAFVGGGLLIAAVALSITTLAVGAARYSARLRDERDRAERNFDLAMQAVDEMLSEVGESQLAYEPRMEEKRQALLTRALRGIALLPPLQASAAREALAGLGGAR